MASEKYGRNFVNILLLLLQMFAYSQEFGEKLKRRRKAFESEAALVSHYIPGIADIYAPRVKQNMVPVGQFGGVV